MTILVSDSNPYPISCYIVLADELYQALFFAGKLYRKERDDQRWHSYHHSYYLFFEVEDALTFVWYTKVECVLTVLSNHLADYKDLAIHEQKLNRHNDVIYQYKDFFNHMRADRLEDLKELTEELESLIPQAPKDLDHVIKSELSESLLDAKNMVDGRKYGTMSDSFHVLSRKFLELEDNIRQKNQAILKQLRDCYQPKVANEKEA